MGLRGLQELVLAGLHPGGGAAYVPHLLRELGGGAPGTLGLPFGTHHIQIFVIGSSICASQGESVDACVDMLNGGCMLFHCVHIWFRWRLSLRPNTDSWLLAKIFILFLLFVDLGVTYHGGRTTRAGTRTASGLRAFFVVDSFRSVCCPATHPPTGRRPTALGCAMLRAAAHGRPAGPRPAQPYNGRASRVWADHALDGRRVRLLRPGVTPG